MRNSRTFASFSSQGKKHPKKASSKEDQLWCGASSTLPSFYWWNQVLATLFSLYTTNSTLLVLSTTCITSNTFFNSSTKFFGCLVVLDKVKLGRFIIRISRTLKVSAPSCLARLYFPTWLVTSRISIQIDSRNSTLVTSPWGFTFSALGSSCSSTFLLYSQPLIDLHGGMMIWNTCKHELERDFWGMTSNAQKIIWRNEMFLYVVVS